MDFLQYYMSMKFKSCCDFFELFLRNFSVSVTLLSQVMGGVWKYLSNCLILSQELSSLLLIIDGPKNNEISLDRYFHTPPITFQNFHHIFISYTYRTMKSSFFQFREKVEGGYQNTCKMTHVDLFWF